MAVVLSLSPLVAVEAVLRWIEVPTVEAVDRDPMVDLSQLKPLFVLNAAGDRWQIPESRWNFFRPDSFLAKKPPGLKRIFVLGGSTVQGRPYAIETAFSTWLRLRLEALSPDTRFEVVNCGGISYASYRVAKILDEVLRHEPDAIVIYTGHNEFLEDREYAEVRSMGPLRRKAAQIAGHSATVRWVQRTLLDPPAAASQMAGEVNARLDHAGGLEDYQRDSGWRVGVEQHFAWTLQRMVDQVQSVGLPIVLCVPASDLVRTPPFKVQAPEGLTGDRLVTLLAEWQAAQNVDATIDQRLLAARRCLAIDPDHAGAHYIAGRLLYEHGQVEQAREHLLAARDQDVCPLRATSNIIESVIRVAEQSGVPVVNTPELLDQRDWQGQRRPDGIPDPVLFVDHLHPTIGGHQQIAVAIADRLTEIGWVTNQDDLGGANGVDQRFQQRVEQQMRGLGEAYFARGQQRLEGLRKWAAGRAGQRSDETDQPLPNQP